jgi:hypothetical protein
VSAVLDDLQQLIERMSPEQVADLDKLLAPELKSPWLPNPGPQTDAYNSKADLLLYGGAAGGGKTDLLIGLALTRHTRSVIFRRAYVDLRGVEERLIEIRGSREGYNGADMVLRTADKRLLEFGALEKPGAEFTWQGRPHDLIGFDEGAQLPEAKVRFVMGWLRSTKEGQKLRAVIASNPPIGGEGDWLVAWFAPWLDPLFPEPAAPGELRWAIIAPDGTTRWVEGPGTHNVDGLELEALSRTFIPARLDDNPYLKGTNYRAQLQSMPEPLRTQLLHGDFMAGKEDAERQVIPTAWVEAAQERWTRGKQPGAKMLALGVDVAQGGKDDTVLAPLYGSWFDNLIVRKGVDTPDGPAVAALVVQHMRNNCQITIDASGGYGGDARTQLRQMGKQTLGIGFGSGSTETTKDGTLGFANMRAELWWRFREALDPSSGEDVALPPDRKLAAELTAPTWTPRGARILVESKDEIRKRLGASTDRADAVILAWHKRDMALVMQKIGGDWSKWGTTVEETDPFA